ncbi:MAG: cell division protein ZapA [Candidatus Obscuribacterales bacterium]|nr:cell division protein ZapA [Steroidobacteraceae bacterium]
MNDRVVRVSVRILEKDYPVACPIEERTALLDAAELLNTKMREIRDGGSVVGLDRIAVMAALNLANELQQLRARDSSTDSGITGKIRSLRERVETALNHGQQLEI